MGAAFPEVTIVVDHAKEGTEFSDGGRLRELEDAFDFLWRRPDTIGGDDVAEPLNFLDTPLTLGRVDGVAIGFKAAEGFLEVLEVLFPRVGEGANIVDVGFDAFA